jgi:hypothetical protein
MSKKYLGNGDLTLAGELPHNPDANNPKAYKCFFGFEQSVINPRITEETYFGWRKQPTGGNSGLSYWPNNPDWGTINFDGTEIKVINTRIPNIYEGLNERGAVTVNQDIASGSLPLIEKNSTTLENVNTRTSTNSPGTFNPFQGFPQSSGSTAGPGSSGGNSRFPLQDIM